MNEKLIEDITQEYHKCSYEGEEFDLEQTLTKHLSDKVIIERKVYEAMEAECTLAAIRRLDFILDNQE